MKCLSATLIALLLSSPALAADLAYLRSLLDATPQGGWVKASTTTLGSVFPTGADSVPLAPNSPSGPDAVVRAWSGFAWDSTRGNIVIYGGGHANYSGNEVYVWQGSNGAWSRGTLPSQVGQDASNLSTFQFVNGDGAPQSAHTYSSNIYVPLNDRFITYGGASWNAGGPLVNSQNVMTGPWWWDPSKADPDKVGGQDFTGFNPVRLGSNSWEARPAGPFSGPASASGTFPGLANATSSYRQENGKDVIYSFLDLNRSNLVSLWRYELGTPGTPSTDIWQQVGQTWNAVATDGTAAIDSLRNLIVRTGAIYGGFDKDLLVFDLSKNNAADPFSNREFGVQLKQADGTEFDFAVGAGIQYDKLNDQFVIWDSNAGGQVWTTRPEFLADGTMSPVWTVRPVISSTTSQPAGNHSTGTLGKWKYVEELGAFIAMDRINRASFTDPWDAEIWLYKPISANATPPVVTPPVVTPPEVTPPEVTPPVVTPPVVTPPEVTPPVVTPPVVTPPEVTPPVVTPPEVTPPEVTPPEVTPPVAADPVASAPVINTVPEPGTWALAGIALAVMAGLKRRRPRPVASVSVS